MEFKLPQLPYSHDALQPHISRETLEYHHGKHHQTYVNKLNALVEGKPESKKTLEELIQSSQGPLFNNAAQTWNHTFYWNCLSPNGGGVPEGALGKAIAENFKSFDEFKKKFSDSSADLFGSGWTWLAKDDKGKLSIIAAKDADNPIRNHLTPILTCDVWEHAYYLDYRNVRAKYIEAFWNLVNWEFVESQLQGTAHALHR